MITAWYCITLQLYFLSFYTRAYAGMCNSSRQIDRIFSYQMELLMDWIRWILYNSNTDVVNKPLSNGKNVNEASNSDTDVVSISLSNGKNIKKTSNVMRLRHLKFLHFEQKTRFVLAFLERQESLRFPQRGRQRERHNSFFC